MQKGIAYLERAVETDPTEPLAHAGLALGYSIIAHTPAMLTEASKRSKTAARKALELDENLAEAHLAIAMNSIYFDWDRTKAENSYKKTLKLIRIIHWLFYIIPGFRFY